MHGIILGGAGQSAFGEERGSKIEDLFHHLQHGYAPEDIDATPSRVRIPSTGFLGDQWRYEDLEPSPV